MPLASQITGGRICKSGIEKLLEITYVSIFGSSRLFDLRTIVFRTIVFDDPRLIRSNLICCRHARMLCWGWTDPCTQLDTSVRPNNSTTYVFQVHWCIKRVNMQCVCWTPFIWATINSPSEVLDQDLIVRIWICGDSAERCVLCRC